MGPHSANLGLKRYAGLSNLLSEGGPVRSFFGPKICGDALDIHEGYILTGKNSALTLQVPTAQKTSSNCGSSERAS